MTRKFCGGCKQEKPASEFHADRKRTDGLQCQCKACTAQQHKKWRDGRRRGGCLHARVAYPHITHKDVCIALHGLFSGQAGAAGTAVL